MKSQAVWSETANAGLEDLPIGRPMSSLPYVLKTPWLFEIVNSVAADPNCRIDAVIVPVRSLRDAAASRLIVERRDFYRELPEMLQLDEAFAHRGSAAGGCLVSLEPIDQARLLATGFHHLIERLVALDVPVVFVGFPRLADDPDYLYSKLIQFMPGVSADQARTIHNEVVEPDKIRVDAELLDDVGGATHFGSEVHVDPRTIDNAALRRELVESRATIASQKQELTRINDAFLRAEEDTKLLRHELAVAESRLGTLQALLAGYERDMTVAAQRLEAGQREAASVAAASAALRESTSWRITAPLRELKRRWG